MLKWILRILFAFVCLIGVILLLINMLSGTGETQKHGLEGAFSQIFRGDAQIGKLNAFNIIPQFDVDASDVVIAVKTGGNINAKHVRAAFGFQDLFLETQHIEALELENVVVDKGVWGDEPITLSQVSVKKTDKPETGQMLVEGLIGTQPVRATMEMESFNAPRPSFALRKSNPLNIVSGPITTTGNIVPYTSDSKAFSDIRIQGLGQNCAAPAGVSIEGTYFFNHVLIPQAAVKSKDDFNDYCSKILHNLTAPASK